MAGTPGPPAVSSSWGTIPHGSEVLDPDNRCKDCGAPIDLDGDSSVGRCSTCADSHWCSTCEDDREECGHPPAYDAVQWRLAGEDDEDLIHPPRFVQPVELSPGQKVDLWVDRGGGYSGLTVVSVDVDELRATGGTDPSVRSFPWKDYVAVSTHNDGKLHAHACLEHRGDGSDCRGDVEYRSVDGVRAWPRCSAHFDRRLDQEQETRRKYPHMRPSDFSELDAGERWDDDY